MEDITLSSEDKELEELVFRRSKRPNEEQRENYLVLLYEGCPHVSAARKVGSTGTAFRSLRRHDSDFRRMCESAESRQQAAREDQVRASLWDILYDTKHPKHWDAVRFAAEIYLSETQFKRIRQVHQRVDMESAIAATLQITVETLQAMPQEKLDELITTFEELEAVPRLAVVE